MLPPCVGCPVQMVVETSYAHPTPSLPLLGDRNVTSWKLLTCSAFTVVSRPGRHKSLKDVARMRKVARPKPLVNPWSET